MASSADVQAAERSSHQAENLSCGHHCCSVSKCLGVTVVGCVQRASYKGKRVGCCCKQCACEICGSERDGLDQAYYLTPPHHCHEHHELHDGGFMIH